MSVLISNDRIAIFDYEFSEDTPTTPFTEAIPIESHIFLRTFLNCDGKGDVSTFHCNPFASNSKEIRILSEIAMVDMSSLET